MIKITTVDAALDSLGEDDNAGTVLANLLDETGDWDWSDDAEHGPEDRLAVVESTGSYWLVYRGSEPDEASRFATRDEAEAQLATQRELILA